MLKQELRLNPGSKWLAFILSPFVISLFFTIILAWIFIPKASKYQVTAREIQKFGFKPYSLRVYEDLAGDGYSDFIEIFNDTNGFFSVVIKDASLEQVNQWNLEGKLISLNDNCLVAGDFDNNKKKEVYLFSLSHDSILLHCISDFRNNVPEFTNVFISKVMYRKGHYEAAIIQAEMDDLNEDGYKELIFGVNSGFSIFPRNVFAYDIHNQNLLKSPYLGMTMFSIVQEDITGDGKNEFILQGYGSDNLINIDSTYHDRSAWLMVLDRKLNFLFKPIEFKGAYSNIWPFVMDGKQSLKRIGFYLWPGVGPGKPGFYQFSKEGKITSYIYNPGIPPGAAWDVFTIKEEGKTFLCMMERGRNQLLVLDGNLNFVSKRNVSGAGPITSLDVDNDGEKEIISYNPRQHKLLVMRSNLSHPVSSDVALGNTAKPAFSARINGKEKTELVAWDHENLTFLDYSKNPMYYLRWFLYPGIYLAILLFTLLIQGIQRYQMEKRIRMEKKITELQMKLIMNQLDPHFTLNAVNSIIYAVRNNEPERATEHLYQFSSLFRHLLLTADQYQCTLSEELSFTENYLKMEQLRHMGKFVYTIVVANEVNKEIQIPKMCIQTAVENAVKHGIAPLKSGGQIAIHAAVSNDQIVLEVIDNGVGRAAAKNNSYSSTQKGLILTRQYFELFTKITNRKVASEIIDLMDDAGYAAGTKVRISVQLK